jgi:hypothetical protein
VDDYDGAIIFRELQTNVPVNEELVKTFVDDTLKKQLPYRLTSDIVRGLLNKKPTGDGYFCSELVADTFKVTFNNKSWLSFLLFCVLISFR